MSLFHVRIAVFADGIEENEDIEFDYPTDPDWSLYQEYVDDWIKEQLENGRELDPSTITFNPSTYWGN